MRRRDVPVLLGESGGSALRWVLDDERDALSDLVRRNYAFTNDHPVDGSEYMGHEFEDGTGRRLLYVEEWC